MEEFDNGISQLSVAVADLGANRAAMEQARQLNTAFRDDAEKRASNLADTDFIESSSELALANRAMEAALTATARSIDFSLLNSF